MTELSIITQLATAALNYVALLARAVSGGLGVNGSSAELRTAFGFLKETTLRARRAGFDWIPTTDRDLKFWALAVTRKILI